MEHLLRGIEQADETQIEYLLQAVIRRYSELFPKWEIATFSLYKFQDKHHQIDEAIAVLNKLKHADPSAITQIRLDGGTAKE